MLDNHLSSFPLCCQLSCQAPIKLGFCLRAWTHSTDINDGHLLGEVGCTSCVGLVPVKSDRTYTLNLTCYMMGRFPRFLPTDNVVLQESGGNAGVPSLAAVRPNAPETRVFMKTSSQDVFLRMTLKSGSTWTGSVIKTVVVPWILPTW